MFAPRYHFTPSRIGSQTDFSPVFPDDLQKYIPVAQKVARYRFTQDQANFLFIDDVSVHTLRLVNYLRNLQLPDFLDREVIERMLWIHDIPEAIVNEERGSDYVTHEKYADGQFLMSQDDQEEAVAREIFSESDFRIFGQMEKAKDIIKNHDWSLMDTNKNGIFAKMLDWIDGRNTFADIMTRWIATDEYISHPVLAPYDTFILCFQDSYQVWMNNFNTLTDPDIRQFFLDFIHSEMYLFHRNVWDPVVDRAPSEIRSLYTQFSESDFFAKSR